MLFKVGFNRCKAPKLQPLGYVSDEVRLPRIKDCHIITL